MSRYNALVYVNDIEICYETLCIDVQKEGGVFFIHCRKSTDVDTLHSNYIHSNTVNLLSCGHIVNLSVIYSKASSSQSHFNDDDPYKSFEFPASLYRIDYDTKGEMSSVTFKAIMMEIAI